MLQEGHSTRLAFSRFRSVKVEVPRPVAAISFGQDFGHQVFQVLEVSPLHHFFPPSHFGFEVPMLVLVYCCFVIGVTQITLAIEEDCSLLALL